MAKHGVYVSQQSTSTSSPTVAASGVPFFIGSAPVQSAEYTVKAGIPTICTSWQEAVERLGYSDNWKDYTLCEAMYSHFKLFGCQPAIFCNLIDPERMKTSVAAADVDMTDHKVKLPIEVINNETLVVKAAGGTEDAYVKDKDYSVYYDSEFLVIETMKDGACYDAEQINVAYDRVTPDAITASAVATGMESIEQCLTLFGTVPDLICAPGFSSDPIVAAVMATKASGINGLFLAKALIDISSAADGAHTAADAILQKSSGNIIDSEQIGCWPMLKLGKYQFHMSTQLAGLMAQVDTSNEGCPYESPSNKGFKCDAMVLGDGADVNLTLAQANMLNTGGIVTALNHMNGWTCWGNYTACYPDSTDVKDYFIPVSRMFGWVGNSLIRSFWSRIDKPMNRRLIDTVLDTANIWLNGLVGGEYLLGAKAEMKEDENPLANLMAGIIKIHIYLTPPSPAQEIDFVLEYNAEYVSSALQ